MKSINQYEEILRRSALPEVMFGRDLAVATGLPVDQVEAATRQGHFGREFYVAGHVAVLRQDFLMALARRGKATSAKRKEVLPVGISVLSGSAPTPARQEVDDAS